MRLAIDKLGAERVMWAIDYPFQLTPASVAFMNAAQVSDSERDQISHRNAERIFGIAAG